MTTYCSGSYLFSYNNQFLNNKNGQAIHLSAYNGLNDFIFETFIVNAFPMEVYIISSNIRFIQKNV
ncbi:hypothetical protein BAX95_12575 [Elizabethkingia meningoseptica]|nr:hypothetical protein BES09_15390 [Elizabethkingia meningoseptica]OHT27037.1 hypothetical protein BFF93_15990 [Elizabethkingia meningoseptica]OPC10900.1 hypothetical protein BAX93_10765 [Elizabethkingia meningoseptica]OPC19051.1 hypothetical protein BAX95_12575 [Elizabethkingia meningoseptica]